MGKVSVADGVRPRRGNACRVKDVGIDKRELEVLLVIEYVEKTSRTHITLDIFNPFGMALLDVLAPKVLCLEKLRALGHLAAEARI